MVGRKRLPTSSKKCCATRVSTGFSRIGGQWRSVAHDHSTSAVLRGLPSRAAAYASDAAGQTAFAVARANDMRGMARRLA